MVKNTALLESINQERSLLFQHIHGLLAPLATICEHVWWDLDMLESIFSQHLQKMGICKLIYAIDQYGCQYSSSISHQEINPDCRGLDLSIRPYLQHVDFGETFILSEVYFDRIDHQPCITGKFKIISEEQEFLGHIAADFDLANLPEITDRNDTHEKEYWRQIKGDPSIRQNLFQQVRTNSAMDEHLDEVNDILLNLMTKRGIFHIKLHYSSSRATLWLYNDPYHYKLHILDEIISPSVCLAYPRVPYPSEAKLSHNCIKEILHRFKSLRNADNIIYLRSASLNIINGMVGLTFSCDGSHYMPVDEFIEKDEDFWFGKNQDTINI